MVYPSAISNQAGNAVQGPQGVTGPQGPAGAGVTGPTGPEGVASSVTGPTGPVAPSGTGLATGDKGLAPNQTYGAGYETGVSISGTPSGIVRVSVDGIRQPVGSGDTEKSCFFAEDAVFIDLAKAENNSGILRTDRTAWTWGRNNAGRLGDGTTTNRSSPISVVGDHSFRQFSATGSCLGLKTDGTLWTWGVNDQGQLAQGNLTGRSSPVSVIGAHSFTDILGAYNTPGALKADGTLWMWGLASSGQLGDNSTVSKSSPVSVVGDHTFSNVFPGFGNTRMALKSDGSAWGWGYNINGQTGDNTGTNRSSPVSTVGGHSFIKIAASSNASHGLKADGSLWGWGNNLFGKIGDNTTVNKSSPVSVVGGHSFIDISSDTLHVTALKGNGTAWSWGEDLEGNMGLNQTSIHRSSPTSVVGGHSFVQVYTGSSHTMFRKADGSVWGCGYNSVYGEVGDGTTTSRSSPVSITGGWPAPRAATAVQTSDKLIWNGDQAGFELDSDNSVSLNYLPE